MDQWIHYFFRCVQILGLMGVRKLLDLMFSQHDLAWLDDILPDKDKKKKEDDKKKKKEKKVAEQETDEEVREMWASMKANPCLLSVFAHANAMNVRKTTILKWASVHLFFSIHRMLTCASLHIVFSD